MWCCLSEIVILIQRVMVMVDLREKEKERKEKEKKRKEKKRKEKKRKEKKRKEKKRKEKKRKEKKRERSKDFPCTSCSSSNLSFSFSQLFSPSLPPPPPPTFLSLPFLFPSFLFPSFLFPPFLFLPSSFDVQKCHYSSSSKKDPLLSMLYSYHLYWFVGCFAN